MNDRSPMTEGELLRKPLAFLPLAMSAAALATVAIAVASGGAARRPDEDAAAHVWRLLMAGQVLVVAAFAARWLSRQPRATWSVLALQAAAAAVAALPVLLLGL